MIVKGMDKTRNTLKKQLRPMYTQRLDSVRMLLKGKHVRLSATLKASMTDSFITLMIPVLDYVILTKVKLHIALKNREPSQREVQAIGQAAIQKMLEDFKRTLNSGVKDVPIIYKGELRKQLDSVWTQYGGKTRKAFRIKPVQRYRMPSMTEVAAARQKSVNKGMTLKDVKAKHEEEMKTRETDTRN